MLHSCVLYRCCYRKPSAFPFHNDLSPGGLSVICHPYLQPIVLNLRPAFPIVCVRFYPLDFLHMHVYYQHMIIMLLILYFWTHLWGHL